MLEHKATPAQLTVTNEELGEVEAIVSVTNVIDQVGDRILPGAYRRTLAERTPKLCWGHDWKMPVGAVLEAAELMPGDPRLPAHMRAKGAGGLWIRGRFNLATQRGRDAFEDVKFYSSLGQCEWSIGYDCTTKGKGKAYTNPDLGCRDIEELTLYEVSPVLWGAAGVGLTGTLAVKGDGYSEATAKLSPARARLREGVTDERCATCAHFLADGPACEVVDGDVAAGLVCDLYMRPSEAKGVVRRVRTPEGARRFGLPIGSPIVDKPDVEDVVVTDDVEEALRALAAGKKVELNQPRTVSTLIDRLAQMVDEAAAKGEKAPNIDLCKVSIKGTNLFCVESKGIPRRLMPQLAGVPTPGSRADRELKKDAKGEVDLSDLFRKHLESKGVKVTEETELASYLRASQNELSGPKVSKMVKSLEAGKLPEAPIFVSRDNYVVDGHHRWAAKVAYDLRDNKAGDVEMPVRRIDMGIIEILTEANKFAAEWGIPQAGVFKWLAAPESKVDTPGVADRPARRLRRWYTHGEGAARIAWGVPGDFMRCVAIAGRHMTPERAKGYCALRHHEALGVWPGREHGGDSIGRAIGRVARAAGRAAKEDMVPPGTDMGAIWEQVKDLALDPAVASLHAEGLADEGDQLADVPPDVAAWLGGIEVPREEEAVSESKRDYSDEARQRMAETGEALPDGSYPIRDRTDLQNAIRAIGRAGPKGSADYEEVRRHIIRRARALGALDLLPEDWDVGAEESKCGPMGACGSCAMAASGASYEDLQQAIQEALDAWVAEALPELGVVTILEDTYPDRVVVFVGRADQSQGEFWSVPYRVEMAPDGPEVELGLPEVVDMNGAPTGDDGDGEPPAYEVPPAYLAKALAAKAVVAGRRRMHDFLRGTEQADGLRLARSLEAKSLASAIAGIQLSTELPDAVLAEVHRAAIDLAVAAKEARVADRDLVGPLEDLMAAACRAGLLIDEGAREATPEAKAEGVELADPIVLEFELLRTAG